MTGEGELEPEVLVSISIVLPVMPAHAVADHVAAVSRAAFAVGGRACTVSVQRYDPEDDE